MFIAKKDNQYWIWSSKKASLDCMPWYKSDSLKELQIKYSKKLRQLSAKYLNVKIAYVGGSVMAAKNKCCFCKKYFPVNKMLVAPNGSKFCTLDHQVKNAYKDRDKGRKIKHKQQKKELKDNDKSYRAKCAQAAFNAFIRFRDHDDNCISCNRSHSGQYHAGHYRSVGAHPELRFEELNCNKQCSACNNHLSGNIADYRINLVKKIGFRKVEWIEGPHEPKKYTCSELKGIETFYKNKLKMI